MFAKFFRFGLIIGGAAQSKADYIQRCIPRSSDALQELRNDSMAPNEWKRLSMNPAHPISGFIKDGLEYEYTDELVNGKKWYIKNRPENQLR